MDKKNKVPGQIVDLVKEGKLVLSEKARTQADLDPWLTTEDLENSIIHGTVLKKEKDERKEAKYKYTIAGPAINGALVYSCGKIVKRGSQFYFVLTFRELR